ncbi:hypothetical protein TURU_122210 [Turdus rufiventris]|nr:hypothetical protein TURU_122210 [Turdus rufiventris]
MRMSRLPEAEHWYVESLRSKSDHIPAHLTYGKLLALTGRKSEAEKYFMKAIQLDPTKGNCYMHYGQFLLEESRLIEAAEMAKKAAELDNTEFDVVFNAAHMLRQASLNEEAEKYYEMAAGLRPNILVLSAADPQLTEKLATLDQSNVIATLLQGHSRSLTSNVSVAPAALEQVYLIPVIPMQLECLAIQVPGFCTIVWYPAALMNLGAILHLNGKLKEAEENYLLALQLKPDDVITQSNLRKLWNIMEKQEELYRFQPSAKLSIDDYNGYVEQTWYKGDDDCAHTYTYLIHKVGYPVRRTEGWFNGKDELKHFKELLEGLIVVVNVDYLPASQGLAQLHPDSDCAVQLNELNLDEPIQYWKPDSSESQEKCTIFFKSLLWSSLQLYPTPKSIILESWPRKIELLPRSERAKEEAKV